MLAVYKDGWTDDITYGAARNRVRVAVISGVKQGERKICAVTNTMFTFRSLFSLFRYSIYEIVRWNPMDSGECFTTTTQTNCTIIWTMFLLNLEKCVWLCMYRLSEKFPQTRCPDNFNKILNFYYMSVPVGWMVFFHPTNTGLFGRGWYWEGRGPILLH